jgi:hypothetical protein
VLPEFVHPAGYLRAWPAFQIDSQQNLIYKSLRGRIPFGGIITMSRAIKKIAFFSAGAVSLAALVFAAVFLFLALNPSFVKARLEKSLNDKTGLSVSLKSLKYRLFPLHFRMGEVHLTYRDTLGFSEMDIGSLEASGKLLPFLTGVRPALSTVTMSGVRLVFSKGPEWPQVTVPNLEDLWRSLGASLSIADRYIIRGGLDIILPEERLSLEDLTCLIRRDGVEKWDVRIESGRATMIYLPRALTIEASLIITARLAEGGSPELEGAVRLIGSDWSWEAQPLGWEDRGFHLDLEYHSLGQEVVLQAWEFIMPRLLRLKGEGRIRLDKNPEVVLNWKARLFDLAGLITAAEGRIPLPAGLSLSGGAEASFSLTSKAGRHSLDGAFETGRVKFSYPYRDSLLSGIASLNVRAENFPEIRTLSGRLEAELNSSTHGPVSAGRMVIGTSFLMEDLRLKMPDFQLSCSDAAWTGTFGQLGFDTIGLRSRVDADLKAGSLEAKAITLSVSTLADFRGAAVVRSKPEPGGSLVLESDGISLTSLPDSGLKGLLPDLKDWEPSGLANLKMSLNKEPVSQAPLRLKLQAGFSGLSFHSPTFDKAAESLRVEAALESELDVSGRNRRLPFRLEIGIPAGETLWSSTYLNWTDNPFEFSCTGDWLGDLKEVRTSSFLMKCPPMGLLTGSMSLRLNDRPEARVTLSAGDLDISRLLEFYRRQKGLPENSWKVRGETALEVDLFWGGAGASAEGKVKFAGGEVSRADGKIQGSGIEADIPFSLSFGKNDADRWFGRTGFVSVRDLVMPQGAFQSFVLEFLAAPNLFLFAPVNMELLGGKVGVGFTVFTLLPFRGGFQGRSTARIEGLDLSLIPSSSPDFRLEGRLGAEFSAVSIFPDNITTRGIVSARLYGGRMIMVNTTVDHPFSPSRTIRGDISITGLDLKRLTDSVPFGQVTGLVNIDIQDFALSFGQTERFTMNIKSVKKQGVSRKFSLKAVDDLTILSSGTKSQAPSTKLLTTFVSSFNYDRMGISCSLNNDVFILRGTIVDKGREYLVRRAWFFGIDVVNAKPNNRISFKDMLSRLSQISQSQEKK